MSFADAMREEGRFTRTENGAVALNTSGDARLDLFGTIGSLREADENRITTLFAEAYAQDKLFATKIAFYARDIRGGLGERKTFRTIIRYMAEKHPEALRPNLDLVGVFGRYDDLYELIGTPLEDDMWAAMKKQFEEDLQNLNAGNAISLLAKWIKTADASSSATRKLGILTAQKLGYPVYNFKRIVRSMRKQIGVVESLMSAGRWDEIKYPEVPSRAMMIYRKAFMKHDAERFGEFISKAEKGEVKINASTLFPYDIVEKFLYGRESSKVLEAQWKALPDYVEKGTNALVMADVSGSMRGRPMATSIGLLTAITTNVLDLAKKPLTYWLVAEGLKSIHDQGAKTDNIVLGVDATTMLQLNLDAQQNNLTIVPLGREVNGIKLQTVVTPLGEVAVALFDTMPTGTAVLFDPSIMAPVHQMVPGKGNFFLEQLAKTGAGETYQIFGQIGLDHGPEWMSAKFTNISTDLPSKLTAATKPGE